MIFDPKKLSTNSEEQNTPEERKEYTNNRLERIRGLAWGIYDHLPRYIVHIIPEIKQEVDVRTSSNRSIIGENLHPFGANYRDDGILMISNNGYTLESSHSYLTVFENGVVEIVRASYASRDANPKFIHIKYEQELNSAIREALPVLRKLDVAPPLHLSIAILDAAGHKLRFGKDGSPKYSQGEVQSKDNDLKSTEIYIRDYEKADANLENLTKHFYERVRRLTFE